MEITLVVLHVRWTAAAAAALVLYINVISWRYEIGHHRNDVQRCRRREKVSDINSVNITVSTRVYVI